MSRYFAKLCCRTTRTLLVVVVVIPLLTSSSSSSSHALLHETKFLSTGRIAATSPPSPLFEQRPPPKNPHRRGRSPRSALSAAAGAGVAAPEKEKKKKKPVAEERAVGTAQKTRGKSSKQGQNDFRGDGGLWEIRILDNTHHFDYQVAEILVKVADLSELQAFRAMRSAERNGSCSIGEYDYEMAEHYTNALMEHRLGCEMNPLDCR